MTRNQFMHELERELKANGVSEIEEILAEYEEHFDYKAEEGKTEEEIARRLASPQDIAAEYAQIRPPVNKFEKRTKTAGLLLLSLPLALVYVFLWAAVAVLFAFSLCSLAAGFCLITTLNIAGLIPSMPYLAALLLGIAALALSLLAFTGGILMALYVAHWGKCYLKWCRRTVNNSAAPAPSKSPKLSKKTAYRLRCCGIVGLAVFVSAFLAAYIAMCALAGTFEPWHEWHWFE